MARPIAWAVALACAARVAGAAEYELEVIARSPLSAPVVAVAIGDSGVVAYATQPSFQPPDVFRGVPGDVDEVATNVQGFDPATLAVGDTGFVGYAALTPTFHVAFYRADGGDPALVYEHDDLLVTHARMNGAGDWAFVDPGDQPDTATLHWFDGALSGSLHDYTLEPYAPLAVNDRDDLAYGYPPHPETTGFTEQRIAFASAAGPIDLIDTDDGYTALTVLGLSDSGQVLILGVLEGSAAQRFYRLAPDPVPVVDTAGAWEIVRPLGIANDGTVAFYGTRSNDLKGIFVGPDPATDAVLVEGDVLEGATILQVEAPPSQTSRMGGVNARGAIAFAAEWGDPSLPAGQQIQKVVIRATPVPEPGALAGGACTLGAVALLARRFRA